MRVFIKNLLKIILFGFFSINQQLFTQTNDVNPKKLDNYSEKISEIQNWMNSTYIQVKEPNFSKEYEEFVKIFSYEDLDKIDQIFSLDYYGYKKDDSLKIGRFSYNSIYEIDTLFQIGMNYYIFFNNKLLPNMNVISNYSNVKLCDYLYSNNDTANIFSQIQKSKIGNFNFEDYTCFKISTILNIPFEHVKIITNVIQFGNPEISNTDDQNVDDIDTNKPLPLSNNIIISSTSDPFYISDNDFSCSINKGYQRIYEGLSPFFKRKFSLHCGFYQLGHQTIHLKKCHKFIIEEKNIWTALNFSFKISFEKENHKSTLNIEFIYDAVWDNCNYSGSGPIDIWNNGKPYSKMYDGESKLKNFLFNLKKEMKKYIVDNLIKE